MKFKLLTRINLATGAVLIALVSGAARSATAQGAFYMEEEKGGRIYVFNDMKAYDAWKKSGGAETGKAITRVGAGENGQTMVFDSEAAIHLYNFRHGRPGEVLLVAEEKKPVSKVTWKDGKTTWESDNAAIQMSNRVQVRFTQTDPEVGDDLGSFRIRRAKTKWEGWAFSKNLGYEVQVNWSDLPSTNPLEYASLIYDFTGQKGFMMKIGQYKVPFGRQQLTSSGAQQFVDRSIVSSEFEKGIDIGVQLSGELANHKIEWRAGMFNGAGRNVTTNDNDKYQYDARVTWSPFGDVKYSEGDLESKDTPLLALAGNFESNDLRGATKDVVDVKRVVWGVDGVFKYSGFSAMAAYYDKNNTPEEGDEYQTKGWMAQVGFFAVRNRFEMAGRYARYDPNDQKANNDRKEYGIGAGYFFNKHSLKVQADYRWLEDLAKKTKDKEFRLQTQFVF